MPDIFDQISEAPKPDIFDQVAAPSAIGRAPVNYSPQAGMGTGMLAMGAPNLTNQIARAVDKMTNLGLRGGGPAVGQALGAMTGPLAEVGVPVGGAIGGGMGEFLAQLREGQGIRPGAIGGAAALGLIPGSYLAKAATAAPMMTAAKMATANTAAKAFETKVDENRYPSVPEVIFASGAGLLTPEMMRAADAGKLANSETIRKGNDSLKNETFLKAHQAGLLLDPEVSNPTMTNKMMSGVAGQSQLQGAASKYNAGIVNRMAKEEIGIADGNPLSPLVITSKAIDAGKPYAQLASLSPEAEKAVEEWKKANFKAKNMWSAFKSTGNPASFESAIEAQTFAEDANDIMMDEAKKVGNPGLVRDVENARVQLAKIHAVGNAANKATGDVDAKVLGGMLAAGSKLTGNLETIARLQQAMPQVMGTPSLATVATKIGRVGGIYGAPLAVGAMLGGPGGAATGMGAAMISPMIAKKTALSEGYQKFMALPTYRTNQPDLAGNFARFATQSAGR